MKLRTTHNSIRIRIRKSELDMLSQKGMVEESINFGNEVIFKFGLSVNEQIQEVKASLENNYLEVAIPSKTAGDWINTNQVGIEINHPVSPSEQLHLLIEKDFPCKDRADEDKSDVFSKLASETSKNC